MAAASAVLTRQPPESADIGRARNSSENPRLASSCVARDSIVSTSRSCSCSRTASTRDSDVSRAHSQDDGGGERPRGYGNMLRT
eukprot:6531916-Prymnesium_polylepis.1